MTVNIQKIFGTQVPRYTSYPTAPHFHDGIGAPQYAAWLAGLPQDAPISLYVHVPFCDTLCWFCGCHTTVVNSYEPVKSYCAMLSQEIALVAGFLGGRRRVSHIHWGGGSPTMLQPGHIAELNRKIRQYFDVDADAEFAIEIDPRGLTQSTVESLKLAGVTRASIGLQDSDPEVQRAINRIQTEQESLAAVHMLRGAGIQELNVDLVYGLPLQTILKWEATLNFAMRLNPDRISVFGYAHVPQFKKHQSLIPAEQLPGLEERYRQAELARALLCAHGYQAIGLDHFAKPNDAMSRAAAKGTLARNFQGYTTDDAPILIGVGASAISSLPQGYAQNHSGVPAYRAAIDAGHLPVARGVALTDDDRMRRDIIERLMCELEVDVDAIAHHHGGCRADLSSSLEKLDDLVAQGAVIRSGGLVKVSADARPAVRLACAAFDQYLAQKPARHSLSV